MIEDSAFLPVKEIVHLQEYRLQELLRYVSSRSTFYMELFAKEGIRSERIRTIADLQFLPVTTKEDLQLRGKDFLCVERSSIIEYTSTSGTLGKPVTISLTENDLERLSQNEFNSFRCADGSSSDVYQLMLTLDRQFMAGMAYYSGIRKMGGGIIRVGPGVPPMQWDIINRLKPTAIVCVPSFIVKLIQFANDHGINVNTTSVKKAICIGENIRNADFTLNVLGRKIAEQWNVQLFSTYASTEMQTAFTECRHGKGGHLQPDLVILELLNDENKPVQPGDPGEVTVTTLGVEGMPLIRYKTGDICFAHQEPCGCGRNSQRLSPVIGRKKQQIKFKGTTLYPPALFDMLNEMEEVKDYVIEVYSNEIGMDEVLIHIVPSNTGEECDRQIRANLQARLRVSPHVRYLEPEELLKLQVVEGERKSRKFLDSRYPAEQ